MNIFALWGMGGLIKANLKVYFYSIVSGVGHEDALAKVLKSRYPYSPDKRKYVATMAIPWKEFEKNTLPITQEYTEKGALQELISAIPATQEDAEKERLQKLIWAIYRVETHLDRPLDADIVKRVNEKNKFDNKFSEVYDSVKKKYLY